MYEITQKNKILSNNILYLIRSLGFHGSQTACKKSCMYKGEKREGIYHRIHFCGEGLEQIPCKIERKKAEARCINKDALVTGIEVERLDNGEYYGFEIDGNRRFLLGDFTVTHNTAFTNFLISKLQYKTLVICHRINIIEQWEYSVKKFCAGAIVQILTSTNKMNPNADIYIINVTTLCKRNINDYKDIGILVVDEADKTVCTDGGSKSLFYIKPKYSIALTATPHRTDRKSEVLELYFGPEIVQRKLFRPFNAYFIKTGIKIKPKSTAMGRLDWDHVLRSQCENEERNDLIVDILRYFRNRKFLVLCKRRDQTERLIQKLESYNEDCDKYISTQKICNYDCRILVSTYSKSGVGFDHPTLNGLIIASDVEEGILQYLGRVFRREDSSPMVFDLVDSLHTLFKHFTTRRSLYEAVGGDVKCMNESFPEFFKWRTMN
jgi:superfamily II DNA or RNA helicase